MSIVLDMGLALEGTAWRCFAVAIWRYERNRTGIPRGLVVDGGRIDCTDYPAVSTARLATAVLQRPLAGWPPVPWPFLLGLLSLPIVAGEERAGLVEKRSFPTPRTSCWSQPCQLWCPRPCDFHKPNLASNNWSFGYCLLSPPSRGANRLLKVRVTLYRRVQVDLSADL